MAHKIIAFIAAFTYFNAAISTDKFDEKSAPEINFELITSALSECTKITMGIKNNVDIVNKTVDMLNDTQKEHTQKINELTQAINTTQSEIKYLQNANKNNNLHIDTLESSINLMGTQIKPVILIGEQIEKLINDVQNLNKNYVSKEEAQYAQEQLNILKKSFKKLKQELNVAQEDKKHSSISYKNYAFKIAPTAVIFGCIAIFYFIKNPLKKRLLAAKKRIKNICIQKIWGTKNKKEKITL